MPEPLKANEWVYVDRKVRPADYSMPQMSAAPDHYTMSFIVSGDRKWFSYERIKIAHSGDVGISESGIYHRNCAMSDKQYDRYIIKFRLEVLKPLIDIMGQPAFDALCADYLHFTDEVRDRVHEMFEEMKVEYEKNSPFSQLILQGMLQRLFLFVYENHLPSSSTEPSMEKFDSRIYNALLYIEQNLEYDPSVEDTAKAVYLSPSHFSRLFRSIIGCTYTEYLTSVKLQRSRLLLENSEDSISKIADKCGFKSANYLSTVFHKAYGCSPKDFRKNGGKLC